MACRLISHGLHMSLWDEQPTVHHVCAKRPGATWLQWRFIVSVLLKDGYLLQDASWWSWHYSWVTCWLHHSSFGTLVSICMAFDKKEANHHHDTIYGRVICVAVCSRPNTLFRCYSGWELPFFWPLEVAWVFDFCRSRDHYDHQSKCVTPCMH